MSDDQLDRDLAVVLEWYRQLPAQFPEGPDLNEWTVEALRAGPAGATLTYWHPFLADLERVRVGDRRGLESVVRYLEADPYYPGTGDFKEKAIRRLIRMDVDGYHDRLGRALVTAVMSPNRRREWRYYSKLLKFLNSAELEAELRALTTRADHAGRHARWVLTIRGRL